VLQFRPLSLCEAMRSRSMHLMHRRPTRCPPCAARRALPTLPALPPTRRPPRTPPPPPPPPSGHRVCALRQVPRHPQADRQPPPLP
jgi:hypothetical protein